MLTKEQREAEFRKDLLELLNKHRAEIVLGESGRSSWYSPEIRVEMDGEFDYDNNVMILEYTDFKL